MGYGKVTRRIYGARHYAPAPLLRSAELGIDFPYSSGCAVDGPDDWMGADAGHNWRDCVAQYDKVRALLLAHGMPDPGDGQWFGVEDYD